MNATSFMKALEAQWPNERIPEESARVYRSSLGVFASGQLQSIYERILRTEQYTPKLARILDVARELGYTRDERRPTMSERATHFQTFEVDGVRYARPIRDPGNPPALPHGASDAHLVIDHKAGVSDEPISGEEAEEAFREGWRRSGAPMNECPRAAKYIGQLQAVSDALANRPDSSSIRSEFSTTPPSQLSEGYEDL